VGYQSAIHRCDPGVQGSDLQLLSGIRGTQAEPYRSGDDRVGTGMRCVGRPGVCRNTSLDARSFFAASTEKFNLEPVRCMDRSVEPIEKVKTFFFADIQNKFRPAWNSVHGTGLKRGHAVGRFGNVRSEIYVRIPDQSNVRQRGHSLHWYNSAGNRFPRHRMASSPGVWR